MNNSSELIINVAKQINIKLFDATPYFFVNIDKFLEPCQLSGKPCYLMMDYSEYPNEYTNNYTIYLKKECDKIINYIFTNSNKYNKKELVEALNVLYQQLNTSIKPNLILITGDPIKYEHNEVYLMAWDKFQNSFVLNITEGLTNEVENLYNKHPTIEITIKDCIEYYLKPQLKEVISKINNNSTTYPTKRYWFITGLEFAKGNISLKITDHLNTNYRQLAISLGNKNYRNYIEGTIKNYKENNTDKNLFYSKKNPQQIIDYCKENDIKVCDAFIDKFNNI